MDVQKVILLISSNNSFLDSISSSLVIMVKYSANEGFYVNVAVILLSLLRCFRYKNFLRRGSLTFKLFGFYFNLFYILLNFMVVPVFSSEFLTMDKGQH